MAWIRKRIAVMGGVGRRLGWHMAAMLATCPDGPEPRPVRLTRIQVTYPEPRSLGAGVKAVIRLLRPFRPARAGGRERSARASLALSWGWAGRGPGPLRGPHRPHVTSRMNSRRWLLITCADDEWIVPRPVTTTCRGALATKGVRHRLIVLCTARCRLRFPGQVSRDCFPRSWPFLNRRGMCPMGQARRCLKRRSYG